MNFLKSIINALDPLANVKKEMGWTEDYGFLGKDDSFPVKPIVFTVGWNYKREDKIDGGN